MQGSAKHSAALRIGSFKAQVDLLETPLFHYDVILGRDFLRDTHASIAVRKRMLTVQEGARQWQLHATGQVDYWHLPPDIEAMWVLQAVPKKMSSEAPVGGKEMRPSWRTWQAELAMALSGPESSGDDEEIKDFLLREYPDVFQAPSKLPPQRAHDHVIPLTSGAQPVAHKQHRLSPHMWDEIESQIEELVSKGFIVSSRSPWCAPLLVVKKKGGSYRVCMDYRALNAVTHKDAFPMPRPEDLFDRLHGARYLTSLDMISGYHQVLVAKEDREKTAFSTLSGHYEWKVMPFGLTGVPATFQRTMNAVLAPLLRKCVVVYLDDILVFSKTREEHVAHLRLVFDILREQGFSCKCKLSNVNVNVNYPSVSLDVLSWSFLVLGSGLMGSLPRMPKSRL